MKYSGGILQQNSHRLAMNMTLHGHHLEGKKVIKVFEQNPLNSMPLATHADVGPCAVPACGFVHMRPQNGDQKEKL